MTDEIKTADAGTADQVKLTIAILLALAGVAGYYVLGNESVWLRWGCVVAGLALAALLLAFADYGRRFKVFVETSRIELRKVVWPTRDEAGKTTLAVFIFVAVASVFFWGLDFFLAWATRYLTGQGG
ncbi:MAG: preprotein translocase subunit SecE [Gammaproteobacteria bacterium]|nr:preprotein translocase subunit SecE [Gammaproteobacteria bacterium]